MRYIKDIHYDRKPEKENSCSSAYFHWLTVNTLANISNLPAVHVQRAEVKRVNHLSQRVEKVCERSLDFSSETDCLS